MTDLLLDRPILVGGAGSSGTTLVTAMLASHPELAGGPELSFFNKSEIYGPWEVVQANLAVWMEEGLPCHGYFMATAFLHGCDFHGLDAATLVSWARESEGLEAFVRRIQARALARQHKARFVEKTPTNVYAFRQLAARFPDVRLVHVVRDGRDVVTSLMRRGLSLFEASARWLYDTAAGHACRDLPQYVRLRYEDVVGDSAAAARALCAQLAVDAAPAMLERAGLPEPFEGKLPSWRASPTGPIETDGVGCHTRELQPGALECFASVKLSEHAAQRLGSWAFDAPGLQAALGYETPRPRGEPPSEWIRACHADHERRTAERAAYGLAPEAPLVEVRLA